MERKSGTSNGTQLEPTGRITRESRVAGEPALDQMFDDPVIQAIMAHDGVRREELLDLVGALQSPPPQ